MNLRKTGAQLSGVLLRVGTNQHTRKRPSIAPRLIQFSLSAPRRPRPEAPNSSPHSDSLGQDRFAGCRKPAVSEMPLARNNKIRPNRGNPRRTAEKPDKATGWSEVSFGMSAFLRWFASFRHVPLYSS